MAGWMWRIALVWAMPAVVALGFALSPPQARVERPEPPPPVVKVVRTVQYLPPTPVAAPPVQIAEVVPLPPPKPVIEEPLPPPRTVRRDLCARHGLRKVETRGGKSWRCRR
jgi:outer membrane biosynthesis protein TonB